MKAKKKKPEKEIESKESIGNRFRRFRESIGKAQHELGAELSISQSTVANIERGKAFPNITYLNYFYRTYQLNINWLLTNEGEMFYKSRFADKRYLELVELMQVPPVEQLIFSKLVELKALLKNEIKTFYDNVDVEINKNAE
jgi:transcriptional regulator with XRE-family HTH domain